ncbi:hypothetical protein ACQ4PT_044875 [Festuca glaucescens]
MDQPRPMTLWEQLSSKPDPAIRDILKIPHEAHDGDRRPCTLMDAIGRDSRGESGAGRINWKPLRDRLWLRRAAHASSTTASNRRADEDGSEEEEEESKAPAAGSMSLMALLEQTDSQWDDHDEEEDGATKSGAVHVDGDGEGREEEDEMVRACCVCMVRHKGAAFIPCGHTFCRPCSRHLWRTRADCPLCNALIHDILHIF